jgi:hypothetical protein
MSTARRLPLVALVSGLSGTSLGVGADQVLVGNAQYDICKI